MASLPFAVVGELLRPEKAGGAAAVDPASQPQGKPRRGAPLLGKGFNLSVFGFTAGLLILLWTALGFQLEHDRITTLNAARVNGENLSRAFAEHVAGIVRPIDKALTALKNKIEAGPPNRDWTPDLEAARVANGGSVVAAIVNAEGHVIARSTQPNVPALAEGTYVGDRPYFVEQAQADTKQLQISVPILGRTSSLQIVVLSRRLNNPDGTFAGIVLISFDTGYLAGFFSDLAIDRHGGFVVVGTDMIIRALILPGYEVSKFIGRSVANTPLDEAFARAPSGNYEAVTRIDGVRRIFNYRTLPDYPLIIVTEQGYDEVVAGFRERRIWLVIASSFVSILFVAAAALLLRRARLQRRAETTLRQSEERFRALIEHANDIVIIVDREGKIIYRSPSATQILGVSDTGVLGRAVVDRIHPDDRQAVTTAIKKLIDEPDCQVHLRARVQHKDGSWRQIAWSGRNALDIPGVGGLIMNSLDITETEALQEQLRQAQKLEAIGKLTGGVAHDFNNLLAVVTGNLDLLAGEVKDRSDLHAMVTDALGASERGAALTRSLLAFARQQPLSPTTVDISKLVRELSDMIRRTAPENIAIEFISAAGLWKCEADPGELQNALLNLVVNARDAMPEGGRLTIETGNARLDQDYSSANDDIPPGQYVMLAVSDTGTGMAPEVAAKAFEPFFTTKDVGKGTGLGLSMVYGFAKQSGGHVKIYSEIGHGTTVRLYLPRSKDAAPEATTTVADAIPQSHGEKILVVEDAPDMRTLTLKLLRSLGYKPIGVAGALEALQAINDGLPADLLLTDVVLPGTMNGRLLAETVQRARPAIKVLYMSGYTEDAILHHGRLDRGVHLLQKPFTRHDLAAKLRLLLD